MSVEFVVASGGTIVLSDPGDKEADFFYGGVGVGLGFGLRVPKIKLPRFTLPELKILNTAGQLKERAESLLDEGEKLSPGQRKAIEDWGDSIAIPRQAHIDVSPTYGAKNIGLAPQDADNLAGAARRDVESMLSKIDEYDADGGCKKAYQKAAKRVLRMTNRDFDKALLEIIQKVK